MNHFALKLLWVIFSVFTIVLAVGCGGENNGPTTPHRNSDNPFTGIFKQEYSVESGDQETIDFVDIFTLTQTGNSVTGSLNIAGTYPTCCTANLTVPITGTVEQLSMVFTYPAAKGQCEGNNGCQRSINNTVYGTDHHATLVDNGQILRIEMAGNYFRQ